MSSLIKRLRAPVLAGIGVIALVAAACGGGAAPTATRAPAPTATRAPAATAAPAPTPTPAKPKPQGKAVVAVGDLGGQITDYHNFVNGNQLVIS
ncbi:MAG: hypothetical protein HY330_00175, partial [Chloroflexi bacterium]|nr:hypothetical protein [Chloroflexota bacterium]